MRPGQENSLPPIVAHSNLGKALRLRRGHSCRAFEKSQHVRIEFLINGSLRH